MPPVLHRRVDHPPSRRACVTRSHREHHAAGARSSEGCTNDPQPLHRQITGDCLSVSDTNHPFRPSTGHSSTPVSPHGAFRPPTAPFVRVMGRGRCGQDAGGSSRLRRRPRATPIAASTDGLRRCPYRTRASAAQGGRDHTPSACTGVRPSLRRLRRTASAAPDPCRRATPWIARRTRSAGGTSRRTHAR